MRMILLLVLMALVGSSSILSAAVPGRPIVVELFTSQGCSSCPPADELLTQINAERPDVLALAFHVTYWNGLGWQDPFSFEAATARQNGYRGVSSQGGIYTPQMVFEGTRDAIGSDRATVLARLRSAAPLDVAPVQATRGPDGVTVTIGAGAGAGHVWLVGYDAQHRTAVGRGENAGATLVESNVVRSLTPLGDWSGAAETIHRALPDGQKLAVLVQSADGRMLGAGGNF